MVVMSFSCDSQYVIIWASLSTLKLEFKSLAFKLGRNIKCVSYLIPWMLNDKLLNSSFKVDGDSQIVTYCESHEKLMQVRRKVWKPWRVGGQVVMWWASPFVVIRLTDLSKSGGLMPSCPPVQLKWVVWYDPFWFILVWQSDTNICHKSLNWKNKKYIWGQMIRKEILFWPA